MSIERTGPRAYEYQYLATACAAVSAIAAFDKVLEIFPEKPGGEDAEISVSDGFNTLKFEIQVKSHAGSFDLASFADVLCHFPARKATANLLQRLLDQPQTRLIIITSGRCNVTTQSYVNKIGDFNKVAGYLLPPLLPAIAAFNAAETTKLKKQRARYCQDQSARLNNTPGAAMFLAKVAIWENLDKNSLIATCQDLLYRSLGIPVLQTGTVLELLLKLIKDGRDSQSEIGPQVKLLLERYQAAHPAFNYPYINRNNDPQLIAQLEKERAIFLSGRSWCGKSTAAKALAKHFTTKLYDYRITSNVETAERFLIDTNVVDRLCILDDPFGHFYAPLVSEETFLKVQQLVNNLPSGKKLIVTANNDILNRLQLHNSFSWIDLTNTDRDFMRQLLDIYVQARPLSGDAVQCIHTYLAQAPDQRLPQPGQLDYLVNNWSNEYLTAGTDLYQIAAIDAERIVAAVRQRGPAAIAMYRLLGLCSDVNTAVNLRELEYILSDLESYPGIFKREIKTISFADLLQDEVNGFPVYPTLLRLSAHWLDELDFLVKCGFIRYEANAYQFRHPLYYEAARLLQREIPMGQMDEVVRRIKKAVATLCAQTSLLAARQLDYLFSHNLTEFFRQGCIDLAIFAAESIFPAVQDITLIFLSSITQLLTEEQADEVQRDLLNYNYSNSSLSWQHGGPFRPKDHTFQQSPDVLFKMLSEEEFAASKLKFLDRNQELPTAEEGWWFAQYIRKNSKQKPVIVPEFVLNRLFNYDEAFIRAIAAFQVFYQFDDPPAALVERAMGDPHPFVIYQGIKGFVRGWPFYQQGAKDQLFPLALGKLADPQILVAATHFLTQFGIGYASYSFDWKYDVPKEHHPAMWQLWPKLMQVFFENAPANLRFNAHRFLSTMDTAIGYLRTPDLASFLLSWIKWMRRSKVYMTYDTTLFAVINYYFNVFQQLDEAQRVGFADELLASGSKPFVGQSMRYYLAYWDELLPVEQTKIVDLLKVNDSDNLYKAIALTGSARPAVVNGLIIGQTDWEKLSAAEIVALFPAELLLQCISINYLSYRYMDISNRDRKTWNPVLGYFIDKPENLLCKLAVKVLLEDLAHGFYELQGIWGDPKTLVDNLLGHLEMKDYIFYLLLEDLTETTCSNTIKRWELLLERSDEDSKARIRKEIVNVIERIEMHDNFEEVVYQLFGDNIFQEMPLDGSIRLMVNAYLDYGHDDPEMLGSLEKTFLQILDKKLRLSSTYDLMMRFLTDKSPENRELYKQIETARHEYFNKIKIEPIATIREKVEGPFTGIYIE
ncbi:hypothetical protein [Mucilaginibacter sp. UYCu711]|uniref:nSTAND3 domain-containing NTPase n=1 Tax=Mucilaginibacter sp. UYCu711 TaxID=3156339 RepID=UPI003D1D4476